MKIINETRGLVLADNIRECRTFLQRLKGWRSSNGQTNPGGVYLTPCAWVHTWGMAFPIEAIFIDRQGRVLKKLSLPPRRISGLVWGSRGVLEVRAPAGQKPEFFCQPGDQLRQAEGKGW